MTRELTFAFPGRLDTRTGGYAYDRAVIAALTAQGFAVTPLPLGDGFPAADAQTLDEAARRLDALPDGALVVIDGLAYGVLDDWAAQNAHRLRVVALVHHPLALETGLVPEEQTCLRDRETRALSRARHVVVTSPMTARLLAADYAVDPTRITVALPGTDPAPPAPARKAHQPPLILSLGSLTRRKGHDILIEALKRVEDLDWQAEIVGSRSLDPATAAELDGRIGRLGLQGRITLAGECADARASLARADIFALASRYEGYGMAFAEALAAGLPVVACRAGAVPEVVPEEASILVAPDDPKAFAQALRTLLTDRDARARMSSAAAAAGRALPRWEDTGTRFAHALEALS